MSTKTSKSKELLNKVYDHLDTVDVTKLSMRELEDFLGVVQKGQFLETFGQTSALSQLCCAPYGGTTTTKTTEESADK